MSGLTGSGDIVAWSLDTQNARVAVGGYGKAIHPVGDALDVEIISRVQADFHGHTWVTSNIEPEHINTTED